MLGVKCLPGLFRVTFSFSCYREDPNYQQFPHRVVPPKLAIKFDVLREEPVLKIFLSRRLLKSSKHGSQSNYVYSHFQKLRNDNFERLCEECALRVVNLGNQMKIFLNGPKQPQRTVNSNTNISKPDEYF